jgi:multiple antibiotic resistance protein
VLLWKSFFIAFSVLLPLINPLGSALVFLGLAGEAPPAVYRSLARKIAINNVIFLAVIELLGAAILNFFGISLPIVQLSGGIVIAAMGWSVLNERDARAIIKNKEEESAVRAETRTQYIEQATFYPFTFPVTSGPGTLVALLTVTAHLSTRVISRDFLAHLGVFLAVVVLSVLCVCSKDHQDHSSVYCAWHSAGRCVYSALHWSANRMERTFSLDRCGSQTLKTNRMSKREQKIRLAASSIKESIIAG